MRTPILAGVEGRRESRRFPAQSRFYVCGVALGNTVLFAGGIQSKSVMSNVVDSYNVGTGKWQTLSPSSQSHGALGGTANEGKAIFAGGLLTQMVTTDIVETYEPVGLNDCSARDNSSGEAATLCTEVSASILNNELQLRSTCMPVTSFLFMHAPIQAQNPFSNGFLCLTGGIIRIQPPGVATGGVAQGTVDLTSVGIAAPGTHNPAVLAP